MIIFQKLDSNENFLESDFLTRHAINVEKLFQMKTIRNELNFINQINGNLQNFGRGILFKVSSNRTVILSGGPLSYQYTLKEIILHYGREDDRGSEHTISGHQFPAEIQLYAFNSQLYANWSAAQSEANGLLAIAILISHTKQSIGGNAQLKHITHTLKNISGKGMNIHVFHIEFRVYFFFQTYNKINSF